MKKLPLFNNVYGSYFKICKNEEVMNEELDNYIEDDKVRHTVVPIMKLKNSEVETPIGKTKIPFLIVFLDYINPFEA